MRVASYGFRVTSSEAAESNILKTFDALDGLGQPIAHISDKDEKTVRFCWGDSNKSRSMEIFRFRCII
jgi:hypothetical protein